MYDRETNVFIFDVSEKKKTLTGVGYGINRIRCVYRQFLHTLTHTHTHTHIYIILYYIICSIIRVCGATKSLRRTRSTRAPAECLTERFYQFRKIWHRHDIERTYFSPRSRARDEITHTVFVYSVTPFNLMPLIRFSRSRAASSRRRDTIIAG